MVLQFLTVIGQYHEERSVPNTQCAKVIDQPADLMVGPGDLTVVQIDHSIQIGLRHPSIDGQELRDELPAPGRRPGVVGVDECICSLARRIVIPMWIEKVEIDERSLSGVHRQPRQYDGMERIGAELMPFGKASIDRKLVIFVETAGETEKAADVDMGDESRGLPAGRAQINPPGSQERNRGDTLGRPPDAASDATK